MSNLAALLIGIIVALCLFLASSAVSIIASADPQFFPELFRWKTILEYYQGLDQVRKTACGVILLFIIMEGPDKCRSFCKLFKKRKDDDK